MGSLESDTSAPAPVPALTIPVIDISGYLSGDASATASIAAALHSAATAPGFFQVVGHGVSPALRARVLERLAAFYRLPAAAKRALHRDNSPNGLRGYEAVGAQTLEPGFTDQKEGFMVGAELQLEAPGETARFLQGANQWPAEEACPGFRDTMMEYFERLRALSTTMFRLMALSLSLEETYFDAFVGSKNCECGDCRDICQYVTRWSAC